MRSQKIANNGAITIEYLIVTLLLMIPLWYAVMGGSGNWQDAASRSPNKGNLTRTSQPSEAYPGIIKSLNDKQSDFADAINQP